MKMIILLFLCFCSVINSYKVHATLSIPRTEDLEIESHLKLLNKPPIRSFQMKFGQIVDCIDINKQPAFDHPLLKNHKLQKNPTFLHRRKRTKKNASPIRTSEFELEKVSCPLGSVPIRRTNKEDLIQMKYYLSNHTHILTQSSPDEHHAILYTKRRNNQSYYGVNAHINVVNPRIESQQMSIAQLAVQNGEGDGVNTIISGWQVATDLYTNLFVLWTVKRKKRIYVHQYFYQSDSFKTTGCYNMLCQGFVQTGRIIFLGSRIIPVSSYGGPSFELSYSISQDPNTKNWWLIVSGISVGYYPAELFSNLAVADQVGWGGRVSGTVDGLSPQMGSGYFPDGDLTHACFMRLISYNVSAGSVQEPQNDLLGISVDNPGCYNLTYLGFLDNDNRYTFQFGGPGGQCDAF